MLDLRDGEPVWVRESGAQGGWPDLDADASADAVVVGAGISGALTALALAEEGLSVLVVDQRSAGRGSTLASTALIQYELDTPLVELTERIGWDAAADVYRRSAGAISSLERVVRSLPEEVAFARRPSLYLAGTAAEAAALEDEWHARRRIGLDVTLLGEREVRRRFPFRRPAALLSGLAAEVDPFLLTLAVLRAAERAGARIRTGPDARVRELDEHRDGLRLRCGGGEIASRHVVVATGYESQQYLRTPVARLKSTFAIAGVPERLPAAWLEAGRCLIWETARPYLYLRTTASGRVLVGGEDEADPDESRRRALLPAKATTLRRRARELFPDLALEPDSAWAGVFAETADGMPVIGAPPDQPSRLYALGFGGNGLTFSQLAAEALRDGIAGRASPALDLFRFGRPSLQQDPR